MLQAIAFYLFSGVVLGAAGMVVSARNPVHSVLFLILAFFAAAGLFVLLGAEFLAMILVVVYVGAVAVLFLFVVMMLDVDFAALKQGFLQYTPAAMLFCVGMATVIGGTVAVWTFAPEAATLAAAPAPPPSDVTNTEALGRILYTDYVFLFQAAGLILLVAMIGAIVLTHRQREGLKRQNVAAQVARSPESAVEVRDIKPGQGAS